MKMKNTIWLVIFSILKAKVIADKWITSASFSKQNSYGDETKVYNNLPLPLGNLYRHDESEDNLLQNAIEPNQAYAYNPFYPEFPYPPRPITLPRPNDVLIIVLEQKMKCSNDTEENQPPQPTPNFPPSRCIWAIVACCAPTSATFRYSCFDFLGCSGSFWQINPCQLPIIMLAVNDALAYYKQFEPQPLPVPPPPTASTNTTQTPTVETTVEASTITTDTTTANAISEEPPSEKSPAS